jgi:hypothetical protein
MKYLRYKNILFDDWCDDEHGIWVCICTECKEAYSDILVDELKNADGNGDFYCSVCGCGNNCEDNEDLDILYIDLDRDKVEFIVVNENLNNTVTVECLDCGHTQELNGWSLDELGYCTTCEECDGSYDISEESAEKISIPRGTIVKYKNKFGIIDGYDFSSSKDSNNINYAFCQLMRSNEKYWSNDAEWLLRKDFEVIGIFVPTIKILGIDLCKS